MPPVFPFIDASDLEAKVKSKLRWETKCEVVFICFMLVSAGWVMWHWWNEFFSNMPWLSLILLLVCLLPSIIHVDRTDRTKLNQPWKASVNMFLGQYSVRKMERIIQEVCQSYNVRQRPVLYAAWRWDGSAVIFQDSNEIEMSPYFFHCLNEGEMKTLLAHEIGHVSKYKKIGKSSSCVWVLASAIGVTTLTCYALRWWENYIGYGWLFWSGFIVVAFLGFLIMCCSYAARYFPASTIRDISNLDNKEIEALIDLEAARRFGMEPMCNVLLKMETREEIFQSVEAAFSPDPNKPIDKDSPLRSKRRAISIALEKLVEMLPRHCISLQEAKPYIEEAVRVGADATESKCFNHPVRNILRWQDYASTNSSYLETEELKRLFVDLRLNSALPLFGTLSEVSLKPDPYSSHPRVRDRLLFIAYNMMRGKISTERLLRAQLALAIEEEDYELAAHKRDHLKELLNESGEQEGLD